MNRSLGTWDPMPPTGPHEKSARCPSCEQRFTFAAGPAPEPCPHCGFQPRHAAAPAAPAPKRKHSKGKVITAVVGGLFVLVILAAALSGDPDESAANIEPPGGEGDDSSGTGVGADISDSTGADLDPQSNEGGDIQPPPSPGANVTVTMVDVGQGDAVVLRTQGATIVYDTGDRFASSHGKLISHLQAQGVATIQALVLSHPHADHAGGCAAVLDAFASGQAGYAPEH